MDHMRSEKDAAPDGAHETDVPNSPVGAKKTRTPVPPLIWMPLVAAFWVVSAWANLHSLVMYGTEITAWSSRSSVTRLLATAAAIGVGVFLYSIRSRNRGMYGTFEIGFSLVLLQGALGTVTPDAGLRLLAGVYVLVRGLESVAIAFAPAKE